MSGTWCLLIETNDADDPYFDLSTAARAGLTLPRCCVIRKTYFICRNGIYQRSGGEARCSVSHDPPEPVYAFLADALCRPRDGQGTQRIALVVADRRADAHHPRRPFFVVDRVAASPCRG